MQRHRAGATVLATALAMLFAVPTAAQEIGQFVVTDEPSGASVALHAAPTQQSQIDPATGIEIRFYLAETGEIASFLSVIEISEATGGYDVDLGVQGSAEGSGGTLVSCTPAIQQGFPARDFQVAVTGPGGSSGTVMSRIVYTGEQVVHVQSLGADTRRSDVEQIFAQLLATLDVRIAAAASGVPAVSLDPAASTAAVPAACFLPMPSVAPPG